MMLDKQIVRRNFNRHAHEYDKHAVVQQRMAQRMATELAERLMKPKRPMKILEIGCGTGILSERLLQLFPDAKLVALDLCQQMVEQASTRLWKSSATKPATIEFVVADAEEWLRNERTQKNEPFDLIVSGAAFQWFNHPEETVVHGLNLLAPGGMMVFSTFLPGTFAELHDSYQRAAEGAEHRGRMVGQTFLSVADWLGILTGSNRKVATIVETHEMVYPTVRQFLDGVKRTGAGNALDSATSGNSYTEKRRMVQMIAEYEKYYSQSTGGVKATYEAGYFFVTTGGTE